MRCRHKTITNYQRQQLTRFLEKGQCRPSLQAKFALYGREFADRVNDIVMEFGNFLYQKSVDQYIAGEAVSIKRGEGPGRLLPLHTSSQLYS